MGDKSKSPYGASPKWVIMRFLENGPSIPDDLLNARDEGRVVFFCGAGVSQARAELPDFYGLLDRVLRDLRAPVDCVAQRAYRASKGVGDQYKIPNLISADRIFGLLQRDFDSRTVESAVAHALRSGRTEADFSAHEILLRLARTDRGHVQLVTTNFDRLFERVAAPLKAHVPPRLPDVSHDGELDGVVYLHGRVDEEYSRADGDGLVLTTADFGHAYLSDGWATRFIREIVEKHVVVFIGYSASDPPIQYFLEGLKKSQNMAGRLYAFQATESERDVAAWTEKGVTAIPHESAGDHASLWQTLEEWALRADDPARWRNGVLQQSMAGPRTLASHVRGQAAAHQVRVSYIGR